MTIITLVICSFNTIGPSHMGEVSFPTQDAHASQARANAECILKKQEEKQKQSATQNKEVSNSLNLLGISNMQDFCRMLCPVPNKDLGPKNSSPTQHGLKLK